MKKTPAFLVVILLLVSYSCEEKIDLEKEKAAIVAVLEEEAASYYASDFERWSATQVHDSSNIRINSTRGGYNYRIGWESISSNMKPTILTKRQAPKQIKTPIQMKIYEETAWILFNSETFDDNNKFRNIQLTSVFLEKHNGKWKEIFRNVIHTLTYTQAETFLLNSINYAKSLGKSVENYASFTGEQFKTGWNVANGYNGFVSGTLNNWRSIAPNRELLILERDDNHIVFSANNMLSELKNSPQYNVTYDEYLIFMRVVFERIADYLGAIYKQETTPDGVKVTITKK